MEEKQPRTYETTGLREGENPVPWWLILFWIGILAVGVTYIVKFA